MGYSTLLLCDVPNYTLEIQLGGKAMEIVPFVSMNYKLAALRIVGEGALTGDSLSDWEDIKWEVDS